MMEAVQGMNNMSGDLAEELLYTQQGEGPIEQGRTNKLDDPSRDR